MRSSCTLNWVSQLVTNNGLVNTKSSVKCKFLCCWRKVWAWCMLQEFCWHFHVELHDQVLFPCTAGLLTEIFGAKRFLIIFNKQIASDFFSGQTIVRVLQGDVINVQRSRQFLMSWNVLREDVEKDRGQLWTLGDSSMCLTGSGESLLNSYLEFPVREERLHQLDQVDWPPVANWPALPNSGKRLSYMK